MADGNKCTMAAKAAVEVVQEECAGESVKLQELHDGVFVEMDEADAPTGRQPNIRSPEDLESVVAENDTLRGWTRSLCSAAGVGSAGDMAVKRCIHGMAEEFFSVSMPFQPADITDETVNQMGV